MQVRTIGRDRQPVNLTEGCDWGATHGYACGRLQKLRTVNVQEGSCERMQSCDFVAPGLPRQDPTLVPHSLKSNLKIVDEEADDPEKNESQASSSICSCILRLEWNPFRPLVLALTGRGDLGSC